MITDRYYYNHLNPEGKEIYSNLYKGVVELSDYIYLTKETMDQDTLKRVFHAITHDNPHLYYFNQSQIEFRTTHIGTICIPQYLVKKENVPIYNQRIENKVAEIVNFLDLQQCSVHEKERRVHDYFARNIVYDLESLQTNDINRIIASHSIIGIFAKQRAVCEGIAKAVKLILNTVDVPCIVVSGEATLNGARRGHSWNIVKLGQCAYHLDVTWDMANSLHGEVNYDYFNLPDIEISRDHFDYGVVPKCDSWKDNYFVDNQLIISSQSELEHYIATGMDKGQKVFYFKMDNSQCNINKVVVKGRDFILEEANKRGMYVKIVGNYNDRQNTGFIKIILP